jgi:surfeit locus 1 family protein
MSARRIPILPTLLVFALLTTLISLGIWQLQRREWKAGLIAQLEAAKDLPLLEPADFRAAMEGRASVQYRRAEMICAPGKVLPYGIRGGSSLSGNSGYLILVSCSPRNDAPDIVVVAGWSDRPDAERTPVVVNATFRGTIIEHPYGDAPGRPQFMLIPDTAVPPLQPSQMPTPADLPDNHLSYAGQWFGLAITLVVIYGLWLRKRLRGETVAVGSQPL